MNCPAWRHFLLQVYIISSILFTYLPALLRPSAPRVSVYAVKGQGRGYGARVSLPEARFGLLYNLEIVTDNGTTTLSKVNLTKPLDWTILSKNIRYVGDGFTEMH